MNSLRIMPRDEIRRRLAAMHGVPHVTRRDEVTRIDVAKWLGISFQAVRCHESGFWPITEGMQIAYSQFFALLDAGCLKFDPTTKKKTLIRVAPPAQPPKKVVRPHVDFSLLKLRFD